MGSVTSASKGRWDAPVMSWPPAMCSPQPFGGVRLPLTVSVLPLPDSVSFPSYIQLPKVPTHRKRDNILEAINIQGIYICFLCLYICNPSLSTHFFPSSAMSSGRHEPWRDAGVSCPFPSPRLSSPGTIFVGEGPIPKYAEGHGKYPSESCLSSPHSSVFPGQLCPCLKSERHCEG